MIKPISIVAVIAGVALIGAPYFTGKTAQTEALNMVDMMNQSPEKYGEVEVVSYDRGVFGSSATYRHELPIMFANFLGGQTTLDYQCDSCHGIIGIDYICKIINNEVYSKFVFEKLGGKDPVSMVGSASLLGGVEQTFLIDEIKGFEQDGTRFDISKTSFTIQTDMNLASYQVYGGTSGFNVTNADKNETFSLGKISIDGDIKGIASNVYVGDVNFSMDSFSLQSEKNNARFSGFKVMSSTIENGDNLEQISTVSVDQIEGNEGSFKKIENATLTLDIKGLNTQAMMEYQTFVTQMQRDFMASLERGDEPAADPAQAMAMIPLIEKMLAAGLNMNIDISGKVDGSANSMRLDIGLLDSLTMGDVMAFAYAPDETLKKVDISLNTQLAKKLIDSDPTAAAMASNSPLITGDGDNYKLDLKLGEKISLNGREMSAQELQALVMSGATQ